MATTTAPGRRLRDRRLDSNLTIDEAWAELRPVLPKRYLPSPAKLQRMETGAIPEAKWDGIVIYGLARIYKCRISDLSEMVAEEYERVGDLLASSSPWITTLCDGQLSLLAA